MVTPSGKTGVFSIITRCNLATKSGLFPVWINFLHLSSYLRSEAFNFLISFSVIRENTGAPVDAVVVVGAALVVLVGIGLVAVGAAKVGISRHRNSRIMLIGGGRCGSGRSFSERWYFFLIKVLKKNSPVQA